ncbi:iron complex outermembrane receptor protein [Hydrogenivirga caldilitoris]|uniref:Iron complex outermembrane receptor protein n=1 Tax=Hydrogenivirga caldilitoris TaxID=246264 RepID=A0A497XVP2_9AQUI|nr:hypothetical protein [Hydrogenivirga caldilitoris]RLJ70863.1 iron complex outermembrane receptor protein [Hydrogenivirga caldilitoris]
MKMIYKAGALLLLITLSFSQDITELLKEYKEASELYNQTRRDSLGHLILFTREDIERMQAHRLADLLKSIHFFTTADNRFGILTLNEYGGYSFIPKHIRLYINDHEVSSLHTGSPFLVWENLPLDSVDHVEVYLGVGAIELGNDPATLIIKVYTKEPSKENANSLRTTLTSRKGYAGVIYSARELNENFSYLFLISEGFDNRKDNWLGGQELSRDARYRYAYFGIYSENTSVEFGYGYIRKDPFMGFALDNVAEKGYTEAEDLYLTLTAHPSGDKSTKFVFSLDNHKRKHFESSSSGLYIPIFMDPFNPVNNPRDFYENAFFSKVTLYLSKEFSSQENKLLTAVSYKLYNSDIDSRYYITLGNVKQNVGATVPFNRQEIYSLIVEDKFSLSPSNLIIGGVKFDKYFRNGGFKDFSEFIARVGYISVINDNLSLKGFVSRSYIPPFFYDTEISGRDLDTVKIPFAFSAEGLLKLWNVKFGFGLGYVRIKDAIVPDNTGRLTNMEETITEKPIFINVENQLSENHKLQAGYSIFLDPDRKTSSTSGGYVRLLSTIGKFDAFGELIYRRGFEFSGRNVEDGYELNSGITYHVSDDLAIKLKGENLLGKAIETPYLVPQTGEVVTYPVRERTLYLSVEWVF